MRGVRDGCSPGANRSLISEPPAKEQEQNCPGCELTWWILLWEVLVMFLAILEISMMAEMFGNL